MNRDAELQAELAELQKALLVAKQVHDGVEASTVSEETAASLKAGYDKATQKANTLYQEAVAEIQAPFEAAKRVYEEGLATAQAALAKVTERETNTYQTKLTVQTRARELELATSQATLHRAEREVKSLATTIDQHRQIIKTQLGIDLARLMK